MENKFNYSYSAVKNREVERIRRKYLPSEANKLDTLKALDLRVQSAGTLEGICVGIVGAIIFGLGMCIFLDVISGASWLTAILMISGALFMIPAYPLYRRIARKTKTELTPEILRLSDEIIKNQ